MSLPVPAFMKWEVSPMKSGDYKIQTEVVLSIQKQKCNYENDSINHYCPFYFF